MKKLLGNILEHQKFSKYGSIFLVSAIAFLLIGGILPIPELQHLVHAAGEQTTEANSETPAYVFFTYFLLAYLGIVIGILFRNALYVAVGIMCMMALMTVSEFWGAIASILLSGYGIWLFISFSIFLAYYSLRRK